MAQQPITLYTNAQEAITKIGAKGSMHEASFEISGRDPNEIKSHSLGFDGLLLGITTSELSERYGGIQFDFKDLETEFTKACRDYPHSIFQGTRSKALEFAAVMMYNVGPETRAVKKPGTDKRWKFRIIMEETADVPEKGKIICNTIYVSTFKNSEPPKLQPKFNKNQILLTVKQASLLALKVLSRVVGLCLETNHVIMTPLAGAIFSKNDLQKIVDESKAIIPTITLEGVIVGIIQSCQSGGQYLENSRAHIAVAAAVCATQNMKDDLLRKQIIGKTFKQYISSGKEFNKRLYNVYLRYSTGGIPQEYMPDRLIAEYNAMHRIGYSQRMAVYDTVLGQRDIGAGPSVANLGPNLIKMVVSPTFHLCHRWKILGLLHYKRSTV